LCAKDGATGVVDKSKGNVMVLALTRRSLSGIALAALSRFPALAAEDDLLAGARKEGQLVWYTTLVVGQIVRPLIQRFEQKYPGVKVNLYQRPGRKRHYASPMKAAPASPAATCSMAASPSIHCMRQVWWSPM
jgi:hypothetical protein